MKLCWSEGVLCCLGRLAGLLYILLLFSPFRLYGRGHACDFLFPVMLVFLLLRKGLKGCIKENYLLLCFPLLAFVSVLSRSCALQDMYEWAVFAYMCVLFMFFREFPLGLRCRAWVGGGLLALVFLAFAYEAVLSSRFGLPSFFSFYSEQMNSTEMGFLARRFDFALGNPNIFGTSYVLAFALVTPCITSIEWWKKSVWLRLCTVVSCGIVLLPLFSSASKHGLMSLAIAGSWLPSIISWKTRTLTCFAWAAVLMVAVVFEATVLFTAFPLDSGWPFINTSPGMYSLHQGAYLRMVMDSSWKLLNGNGARGVQERYGKYVNSELTRETLERYNAMASYENFLTYMDPHNEYLNLASLFGMPVLLCCLAFWCALAWCGRKNPGLPLFILAMLCCCLWDDLLSKRQVWTAAAILFEEGKLWIFKKS